MLSWISSDFFARSPVLLFPVIALCIFMGVFTLGAVRAFLTDRRELDALSRLPLQDDGLGPANDEVEHV
ncbi:MAG: hypothetical protein OXT09_15705 [Myxococcales bacterium]|nr:hypothetical protein [Myxococcales bacterium]